METNDPTVVVDHILESKNNLEIALDVSFAYRAVRHRLIVDALHELERILRETFTPAEWDMDSSLCAKPFGKYHGLLVMKRGWAGRYKVGISAERADAKGFIIGVHKTEEGSNPVEGLKAALDSTIRRGVNNEWWDWYHVLDHPYCDWDNKEILVSMYEGSAAKHLGDYLRTVASAATPCIDKYLSARSK